LSDRRAEHAVVGRRVCVLVVGAVIVAACGTTTQYQAPPRIVVKDPTELIASSADATDAAKTAQMSASMSIDMPLLPNPVQFTMDGPLALDGSRADLEMDMSSMLSMIPGAPASLVVEARVVDGVTYIDFGDFFGALAHGRAVPPALQGIKWLKVDVASAAGTPSGTSPGSFTQYLQYLRGVAAGVREIGGETIRGVATTHYQAQIDKSHLLDQLGKARDSLPSAEQKLLDQGLVGVDSDPTVDVWIGNGDHLVHRLMLALDMTAAGQSMHMNMSLDLYDFGVPVDVQAPPASQVRDLSDLSQLALGSAT
jgi:hypothetical protein